MKDISDMYNDAFPKLDFKKIAEKNNIPNTLWALTLLSFRLWVLCESILSCIDFYSVAILFRAFIEHFFKHIYIFLSCLVLTTVMKLRQNMFQ